MNISEKAWTAYTRQLARLNEKSGQLLADYIAAHGTGDTEALIDYAYALVTKYGEGSAALAAQMYDELAALQNVRVPPAEPAPTAQYGEVAKMVQATRESPPQKSRPAMCWRLSARPATPQAHGRTATLKCGPLPRARALTQLRMQAS